MVLAYVFCWARILPSYQDIRLLPIHPFLITPSYGILFIPLCPIKPKRISVYKRFITYVHIMILIGEIKSLYHFSALKNYAANLRFPSGTIPTPIADWNNCSCDDDHCILHFLPFVITLSVLTDELSVCIFCPAPSVIHLPWFHQNGRISPVV